MRKLKAALPALVCAALLASCSDNDTPPYSSQESTEVNPAAYGPLGGSRVVIWNLPDGDLEVPLYGDRALTVKEIVHNFANHPEGFTAIVSNRADGTRALHISAPQDVELPRVLSFDINLEEAPDSRDGSATTHTLTVVTRLTATDAQMEEKVAKYDCLRTTMGRGMNMGGELGGENLCGEVLDYNTILPLIYDGMNPNETHSRSFEYSNATYTETASQFALQLGVAGSKGIDTSNSNRPFFKSMNHLCFTGSFDFALDVNRNVKEYFEYDVFCYVSRMLICKLSTLWSAEPSQLVAYLDSYTNDVLNNSGTEAYKKYDNTKDGIFSLFDAYGTHVVTKGHFGGRWTYLYGRKQNAYQYSTATSSHASMGLHNSSGTANPNHPFAQWYVNKMTASGIDVNVGVDTYNEEIEQTSASFAVSVSRGGINNSDPNVWEASFDCENPKLALIAFGDEVTPEQEDFGGLLELSMFCIDEARQAAILEYIDEYIESQIHGTTNAKMILADVYMLKDDDNAGGGVDPTKQRVMTDPFGVTRLYTPMYVNQYGRNEDRREKAVDTSGDDFISVADACDQYWYAAIDWDYECNGHGIIDICFSDKDDNQLFADGYTRRGARADSSMNWDAIDNNYLCVQYKSEHNVGTYITGFGLCYGNETNNSSGLKSTDIFSTSVGTEMTFPFSVGRDNFEKYWTHFHTSVYSRNSWWGENMATRKHFYPVYTTEELPRRCNSGTVCLPKGS